MVRTSLVALFAALVAWSTAAPAGAAEPALVPQGTYSAALVPPWTLLMVTQDTTVDALLGDDPAVVSVFRWDSTRQTFDAWQRDAPAASRLSALRRGDGVWVRTSQATTARQPVWSGEQPLRLSAGWSLVSWTGDAASAEALASTLEAERIFAFDLPTQTFVDLVPSFGEPPDRVIRHGDVLWARRSRSGAVTLPARTGLRLEVVAHHDLTPDGVRSPESEAPYAGLAVAGGPEHAASYVGGGVYVFPNLSPGPIELTIGGDASQLLLFAPDDVRLPFDPLPLALENDSTLTVGVIDGRLANPTAGAETAVRPFGAPNGAFGTHQAVDFFVPAGTTILTPLPGEVMWAGFIADAECGTLAIAIEGPYGGLAWILHFEQIYVELGQRVGYATPLGTLKAAADDECIFGLPDHTHLEYRLPNGEPGGYQAVDPEPYLITPITVPRLTGVEEE